MSSVVNPQCYNVNPNVLNSVTVSWDNVSSKYQTVQNPNNLNKQLLDYYNESLAKYNNLKSTKIANTDIISFKGLYACESLCVNNNTSQIVPTPSINNSPNTSVWNPNDLTCSCPAGYYPDYDTSNKIIICRETRTNNLMRTDLNTMEAIRNKNNILTLRLA